MRGHLPFTLVDIKRSYIIPHCLLCHSSCLLIAFLKYGIICRSYGIAFNHSICSYFKFQHQIFYVVYSTPGTLLRNFWDVPSCGLISCIPTIKLYGSWVDHGGSCCRIKEIFLDDGMDYIAKISATDTELYR